MCGLNDDQTLWITFYNISILVYSTCIADKWFKGLQTGNKAPPPVCIPTFLLASSSSSLRTHPASVSSGLVRGDSCWPSEFWIRTTSLSVPVPPTEPLPLTTTWWGLSAGDWSDPGLSGGGRNVRVRYRTGQWWWMMEFNVDHTCKIKSSWNSLPALCLTLLEN